MISGLISQLILLVLLSFSLYTFYETNVNYETPRYLKWLNVMLLVLTIYGIIPIIGGWTLIGNWHQESTRSYIYLRNVYSSILPVYAFYYFTLRRQITEKNMPYLFVAFLTFSVFALYQKYLLVSAQFGKEEVTNNMGYYFIPLIPMLQMVRMKDWWKYFFIVIIFVCIMMAMKRGAILTGGVLLILFLYDHFKGISSKHIIYVFLLSLVVLFFAFRFTSNLYDNSPYFKHRVEQTRTGYSSHRDEIYTTYYNYFISKTTPLEFLIGNGANATIALLGEYAHNDWLEFAINQGIIGIVMYLLYWIVFFMEWKNYRGPTRYKQTLGAIIIAYFMIALYSMSIDNMPTAATLCIGYCLAVSMRCSLADGIGKEFVIRRYL